MRPDASGSKTNEDPRQHHRDGFAAGPNDTRATSAELDRDGEQATKRKRRRITQACRRCKTVSLSEALCLANSPHRLTLCAFDAETSSL